MIDNDAWDQQCSVLARRAAERARKQTSPPKAGWQAWSRRMERLDEYLSQGYFPYSVGSLSFGSATNFESESDFAYLWREASNRMKRDSELWVRHAERTSDPWGRWCTSKAVNAAGGRSIHKKDASE